jgi:hypothetical protein
MKQIASLLLIALLSVTVSPASAADTVYPHGSRVGLTPIMGLVAATNYVGFETADQGVRVLLSELPGAAFGEVDAAFKSSTIPPGAVKPESLETTAGKGYYTAESGKDGAVNVRRYSLIVPGVGFTGYVAMQVAEVDAKIFSDAAVKQMLSTVAVRELVPVEEQLALMPFKLRELSNFKTVRTLAPGAAMLLADGSEQTGIEAAPFMVLGLIGSAPEKPDDRGRFAQQVAAVIPGLRDARITMSEPVRIEGAPGFETRIDAVSGKDNTPVTVVQWLRFGSANVAVRIIASAPRTDWAQAFPRFRAVRDGLQSR